MRSIVAILAATAVFSACGSAKNDKKSGNEAATSDSVNGMTVADEAALPKCDDNHEGQFVFVTTTKSFEACSAGVWTAIDVKGAPGEAGKAGAKGAKGDDASTITDAIKLFQDYRKGILRVTLLCTKTVTTGACANNTNYPVSAGYNASAFVCGTNKVCTNRHAADCNDNNQCYTGAGSQELSFQAPDTDNDSVGDGTTDGIEAFFTTNDQAGVDLHPSRDLAQITVTDLPEGTPVLPMITEAAELTSLDSILSLSYPLGMHDIYVDVGYVNVADLDDCSYDGSCPSNFYDFSTTNDTDHGSSGSPLIDVKTGKVVGLTSAGTEGENANYTWAIDASNFEGL